MSNFVRTVLKAENREFPLTSDICKTKNITTKTSKNHIRAIRYLSLTKRKRTGACHVLQSLLNITCTLLCTYSAPEPELAPSPSMLHSIITHNGADS